MRLPDGTVRKKRRSINAPRQAHEITCTCFRRLRLLGHDRTRRWLIESLDEARGRLELALWAYVIMPDHFHVLFFPERDEYDMGVILKAIKQPVGQRAIAWLRRNSPEHLERLSVRTAKGPEYRFFQPGGGYDRNLFRAEAMWKSVNYLHMNPVRARLVARPTDWEWSSARWYAGDRNVPLLMDGTPPAPGVVTPGGTGRRR